MTWRARWIAPREAEKLSTVHFRARNCFRAELTDGPTLLRIAAESTYRLLVNGVHVGDGPVRGSRTRSFFDTYDVGDLLRQGDNWIACELAFDATPSFRVAPFRPGLIVQLDCRHGTVAATSCRWEVRIASDWRAEVPRYTFQQGPMEWRDLSLEPTSWTIGQDELGWTPATEVCDACCFFAKRLLPRDIPALRQVKRPLVRVLGCTRVPALGDENAPAVAARMTDEPHTPMIAQDICNALVQDRPARLRPDAMDGGVSILLEFARHFTNGITFDIDAPAGAIVDIAYEEQATEGTRLRAYQPHTHGDYAFADRYVLREGRQTILPRYPRGGRLAQIVVRRFARAVTIWPPKAIESRYPADNPASFESSDQQINEVWNACLETLCACTLDTFVDCPWREGALWMNDLLVTSLTWMQAYGDPRPALRSLRLCFSEQRPDGLLPGVCPTDGHDRHVLPVANLLLPTILSELLLHGADAAEVGELVQPCITAINAVASWIDGEGLVIIPSKFWDFVDWSYSLDSAGPQNFANRPRAVINWIYCRACADMARLARHIGRYEIGDEFQRRAAASSIACNRAFWSESLRGYADGTDHSLPRGDQLTQAVALLALPTTPQRTNDLLAALQSDQFLRPELFMLHVVMEALGCHGLAAAAVDLVRRFWGPIVEGGSRTIWEANVHEHGKAAFGASGSLCHAFATGPVSLLQRHVLGVQPIAPSFDRVMIRPQAADLAFARGTVPTPKGPIQISWQVEADNSLELMLDLPKGCIAVNAAGQPVAKGLSRLVRIGC